VQHLKRNDPAERGIGGAVNDAETAFTQLFV
jgi:hypothetical protein